MPYRRRVLETGRRLCFDIGRHLVRLALCAEGWTASVDGLTLEGRFSSQAQAWEQGVRVALQLEDQPSGPARQGGRPAGPAGRGQVEPGEEREASEERARGDA
jgi:hypothetical protein